MVFDFEKFARITASVYPPSVYSVNDALGVFAYYFKRYEAYTGGKPHPPIKALQIVHICEEMPYLTQEGKAFCSAEISPWLYPLIIDQHFETKYRGCDYNINHFFSGKIRALRLCEVCHNGE